MRALDDMPAGGVTVEARGVSGDGSVIVGWGNAGGLESEAFRWTAQGGLTGLGNVAGGFDSRAAAVSEDGSVVVGQGYAPNDTGGLVLQAFRWTEAEGMRSLGLTPYGSISAALGVSGDGDGVVGLTNGRQGTEAFVWREGAGIRTLWDVLVEAGTDPAADGWTRLLGATGVDAAGHTVVGYGVRGGNQEAFSAVLIPEPGAAGITLLLPLLLRRRAPWRGTGSVPPAARARPAGGT